MLEKQYLTIKQSLILFFVTSLLTHTSLAQAELSIRTWSNGVELLESKVMEPLRKEMANRPCENDQGPYTGAYLDQLQLIRADIDPPIYLMFREVAQAVNHEVGAIDELFSCETQDMWPLVEASIYRHLEYTANILTIIQTAYEP